MSTIVLPERLLWVVAACAALAALSLETALPSQQAPADGRSRPFTAYSTGLGGVVVSSRGQDYLRFGLVAWGPDWAWTGIEGETRREQDAAVGTLAGKMGGTGVPFRIGFRAAGLEAGQMRLDYDLQADADTRLTLAVVEMAPGPAFEGREVAVISQGRTMPARYPFGREGLGKAVEALRLTDARGRQTTMRFDPPCEIATDGAARLVLAAENLPGGRPRRLSVRVELPGSLDWYPSAADIPDEPGIEAWYRWQGTGNVPGSVLGMEDWATEPAGKRGRILRRGEALVYDGKPLKLWGLNLCYGACAPDKPLADRRAAFYHRYGINAVRLHKYADGPGWAGIQSKESAVAFDPAALDRMDYQVARLKENGIYVELSAHFGALKLGTADRRYVPYLEEFGTFRGEDARVETPHSALHYAPELQDVHILQTVNLLKHRNPYTGLTYAQDPAVAFVEIINEQSILFYSSMAPLKASPTLRRQVARRFCEWLRRRYGTHEKLAQAWGGPAAFDSFQGEGFPPVGERLDRDNILPLGNPWYWDPAQLNGSQAFRERRLLDTLEFLYSLQNAFYARYVNAVREAGYRGEIVASNWQAGRAFSHYANLHSDALVGTIDRHNYFGENAVNASMLSAPGSGLLSTGLQQVADRPFMLSEWIHVFPNEMGVEGPSLLGAYGMGLQGWDVSFMFQNGDEGRFSDRLGRSPWDVAAPQVMGVFPAVARMVRRGDVKPSAVVAVRNVHPPSLFQGRLGFEDTVKQGYDAKELDSSKVSAGALAVARCVVAFTLTYRDTPVFDMRPYRKDGFLTSTTGQLRWKEGTGEIGGFFTVNTPGTAAVVGYAGGRKLALGRVTIEPQSGFGAVFVTARDRSGTLAASRDLLVVAVARARNTGMKIAPGGDRLLAVGTGPVRMEPVKARITLRRDGTPKVALLDHDGKPTGRTLAVSGDAFTIDGARDRTCYYLVSYPTSPRGVSQPSGKSARGKTARASSSISRRPSGR